MNKPLTRFRVRNIAPWIAASILAGCAAPHTTNKPPVDPTVAGEPSQSRPATASAEHPLKALKAQFRKAYNAARDQVVATLTPLIVVRFSDMYLMKDGQIVAEAKGIPEKYHLLHLTAHVPLVVTNKILPFATKPLSPEAKTDLADYRRLVAAAIPDLPNYGFTTEEVQWQEVVLNETDIFLGQVAGAGADRTSLSRYLAKVNRAIMELADRAGAAQVDATHAAIVAWRKQLSNEEWAHLRVIIVGTRQPRRDYAQTQYFSALLPDRGNSVFPGESGRVFYVEESSIDRADRKFENQKEVMATVLLDEAASEVIFRNRDVMNVDIMSYGAKRRIAELDLVELR